MNSLEEILHRLNAEQPKNLTRRVIESSDWDMDAMLNFVTAVGKQIDPRFVIDKDNRAVYENLIYWLANDPRMEAINPITSKTMAGRPSRGIYLAGITGSGKTVAMKVLSRIYSLNRHVYGGKEVKWIERRADDIAAQYAKTGDLEDLKTARLLCIQDLGSEPLETLYMGNRVKVLQSLLEHRGDDRNTVTMVTSNLPISHPDMMRWYGERAVSRMYEMMNYLTLPKIDRRKNF